MKKKKKKFSPVTEDALREERARVDELMDGVFGPLVGPALRRDMSRPEECMRLPRLCWADFGGSALLSVLPRGGTPRCMACGGKVRGDRNETVAN